MITSLLAAALFIVACSPPGPAALVKGKKLLDDGQIEEAVQEFKTATSLMPTNAVAWNYLGLACHHAGQWTNAIDAYSRALRYNRDLLETRYNLGCVYLEQDRLDSAKAEFTAYVLRRGNAVEGWLKLGDTQLRQRDLLGAEKSYREALKVNAQDVEALNGLGLTLVQRGRPREAVDAFTEARKAQPNFRPAMLNLATVLSQHMNDRAGAVKIYREYLALEPRDANWEAVNGIVKALNPAPTPVIVATRPTVSTNTVATPVASNPTKPVAVASVRPSVQPKTNSPAPITRATNAPVQKPTAQTPTEVAKSQSEPAVRIVPDDARVVSQPADAPSSQTRTGTATATATDSKTNRPGLLSKLNPFKRETKTAPENPPKNSAVDSQSSSNPTRTTADLSSGDRKAAEQALAQGQQAERAGRLAEALQSYRRATQLDGSYFEAHYCVGLAAFQSRSYQVASAAWESAIALRPDSADARYNFALTLKASGQPQAAADELERLLSLHPDEARGHLTLGNLYADQLRDIPRARLHYNKVLQLDPRNPQAQAIRYWLIANPA